MTSRPQKSSEQASRSGELPPFDVTFERLVARAALAAAPGQMKALHEVFEQRTGAFGPDDPWFEARSRAFWDDVMTRQDGVLVAGDLDRGELLWAEALRRSHRGLFRSRTVDGGVVLSDVLSGAELLVHHLDEALRDTIASTSGLFDGTTVAVAVSQPGHPAGLALLPGAVFHPEEAERAIATVVTGGLARGIAPGALLDALLRMELSLSTLSRVKPSYAYRVEALTS